MAWEYVRKTAEDQRREDAWPVHATETEYSAREAATAYMQSCTEWRRKDIRELIAKLIGFSVPDHDKMLALIEDRELKERIAADCEDFIHAEGIFETSDDELDDCRDLFVSDWLAAAGNC